MTEWWMKERKTDKKIRGIDKGKEERDSGDR